MLDARTVALMGEFFTGQKCCHCKKEAERYYGRKFFCAHCLPSRQERPFVVGTATEHRTRGKRDN